MQKHLLNAAVMAAAQYCVKEEKKHGNVVTIKARPETPVVAVARPMDMYCGDAWRRSGKRRGQRAT